MSIFNLFKKQKADQKKVNPTSTEILLDSEVAAILDLDSWYNRKTEAIRKLKALGPAAIPSLVKIVKTDYQKYMEACEALAQLGDVSAIEPLFQLLTGGVLPNKVTHIAAVLSQLVDQSHANMFLDLIKVSDDDPARGCAALVLGHLAGNMDDRALKDQIVDSLITTYNQYGYGYGHIITALGETKDSRVVDSLLGCYQNRSQPREAIRALGNFSEDRVVDALTNYLAVSPDSWSRDICIESLGQIGGPRVFTPLMRAFHDSHNKYPLNRKAAAIALGQLGNARAIDPLINALSSAADNDLRAASAKALGLLKDAKAIKALKKAQHDTSIEVREAATEALTCMNVDSTPPTIDLPPQILGTLVLSHSEISDKSSLLWEIANQQLSLGFHNARGMKEIVIAAGDLYDDQAYVYASIRANFSQVGDQDIMSRTYSYDFKAPDGNYGKYYVILDKAK